MGVNGEDVNNALQERTARKAAVKPVTSLSKAPKAAAGRLTGVLLLRRALQKTGNKLPNKRNKSALKRAIMLCV